MSVENSPKRIGSIRRVVRTADSVVNFTLGDASAESVFKSRVKKIRRSSSPKLFPVEISYKELPFGKFMRKRDELGILAKHFIPGVLSVFLKRAYWIQGPFENVPLLPSPWAVGDVIGLARAGLLLSHEGVGKEVILKAVAAAIPIISPTAPMHAVIDKYLAERYVDYGVKAFKTWSHQFRPKAQEYYRQNHGVGRIVVR